MSARHVVSVRQMQRKLWRYSTGTRELLAELKACSTAQNLQRGKQVHAEAVECGCDSNIYVANALINMYAKCGSMVEAQQVFDSIKQPSVVSGNALILGYAENGKELTALDLFRTMKLEGPAPNRVTFLAALKACMSLGDSTECLDRGKEMHNLVMEQEWHSDIFVQSTLVSLYAKCGSMIDARQVFDSMKNSNVVSWNALILGYADNGKGLTALNLFTRMRSQGPPPSSVTFTGVLKACALLGALEFGRRIHSEINEGHHLDTVLVTCLVDFYAKCGSLVEAQSVFEVQSKARDMITWNALFSGFSSCGATEAVFELFERMGNAGFTPDRITCLCILACCSQMGLVEKGKECFDQMPSRYGVLPTVKHYNCMVDIFGRSNKLDEAMALLQAMPYSSDDVSWLTVLGACSRYKNVEIGRLAFQSLVDLNERDAATYVLMGRLYASRGMLQEQQIVMGMSKACRRKQGEAYWTNEVGGLFGGVTAFQVLNSGAVQN